MHGNVSVPLLEPIILFDVMQVISPDHTSSVHFQLGDDSGQDAATDRNVSGEGALLVNVGSLTGLNCGRKKTR